MSYQSISSAYVDGYILLQGAIDYLHDDEVSFYGETPTDILLAMQKKIYAEATLPERYWIAVSKGTAKSELD